jgi:hypothetical protein
MSLLSFNKSLSISFPTSFTLIFLFLSSVLNAIETDLFLISLGPTSILKGTPFNSH